MVRVCASHSVFGLDSGRSQMWLSLMLVLALFQGFFSEFSGFSPYWGNNFQNFNSTRIEDLYENHLKLINTDQL